MGLFSRNKEPKKDKKDKKDKKEKKKEKKQSSPTTTATSGPPKTISATTGNGAQQGKNPKAGYSAPSQGGTEQFQGGGPPTEVKMMDTEYDDAGGSDSLSSAPKDPEDQDDGQQQQQQQKQQQYPQHQAQMKKPPPPAAAPPQQQRPAPPPVQSQLKAPPPGSSSTPAATPPHRPTPPAPPAPPVAAPQMMRTPQSPMSSPEAPAASMPNNSSQGRKEAENAVMVEVTRDLVKRFISDIWNRGEIELIPRVCHPSLRFNGHVGMDRVGHEGFSRMVSTVRDALTDYHCEIHSMVVETNKAFCRLRFTGKHTGNLLGYPPTGKTVAWMGASEFTCKSGKILKVWELGDVKSLEEQLKNAE